MKLNIKHVPVANVVSGLSIACYSAWFVLLCKTIIQTYKESKQNKTVQEEMKEVIEKNNLYFEQYLKISKQPENDNTAPITTDGESVTEEPVTT